MSLRVKALIFLAATFFILEAFQFLVTKFLLEGFNPVYTVVFVGVATIAALLLTVSFLDHNYFYKLDLLTRRIPNVAKSDRKLAGLKIRVRDEISLLGEYLDSTTEKLQQAEDALQHWQSFFTVAQKILPLGRWDFNLRTGKVHRSEELHEITGAGPGVFNTESNSMMNLIHLDDRPYVKKALVESVDRKEPCSIDYKAILPGGIQCTIHAAGEVKYFQNNEVFRLTGVLYDITRQKALEDLHSADKEESFRMADISPNPLVAFNADFSVKYVNQAFEKMTGFLAKDVIGIKPPYPWWPPDMADKYTKLLTTEIHHSKKTERLFRKKNGKNVWFELTTRVVKKDDDTLNYLVYWFDCTESKQLKENMQFYISEITRAQEEERKRIAYEIHDEIIQSLASLGLEMDALGKEKYVLREDLPARLQDLRSRTHELVDRLRTFSYELHPSVIDHGLVAALENLVQETIKGTKLDVQFDIHGRERRLPVEMELCLFRIAQEAVRNIVKHSGATEAVIRIRYTRNAIRLIISDNGIGFELPEVVDDLASRHKLGMISMRERANYLNGEFSVRSKVGKGTTVMIAVKDKDLRETKE